MHILDNRPHNFALLLGATSIAITLIGLAVKPAAAQFSGSASYDAAKHAYFVTGNTTLSGDVTGNEVFVGKDNATSFTTLPGSLTLNIVTGATTTFYAIPTYPDGNRYEGVNVFGNHKLNTEGGSLITVRLYDISQATITGGNTNAVYSQNKSTTSISGGTTNYAYGNDDAIVNILSGNVGDAIGNNTSTVNISGGSVNAVNGNDASKIKVSGGNLPNGLFLSSSMATVNFVGSNLSYFYNGYGNNNPYAFYADTFTISGFVGNVNASYKLYIFNPSLVGNDTPRQFTFSSSPAPEPGTLGLLLPLLAVSAIAALNCKRGKAIHMARNCPRIYSEFG